MSVERKGGATPQGGGLNERALEPATEEPLSGSGGAAGGGTLAGDGDPSGEDTDRPSPDGRASDASADGNSLARTGKAGGVTDSEEAAEAAALGPADGSLADAAGGGAAGAPNLGESLRGGAGRDIGSGTASDKSGLGGGGTAGQNGGGGPKGTASPGGDKRG